MKSAILSKILIGLQNSINLAILCENPDKIKKDTVSKFRY